MTGRFALVALLGLMVALVLPAASGSLPPDGSYGKSSRVFLAGCAGGPVCVDIDVRQGDTPDPVAAGNELIYRITMQNHGPDPAPGVVLQDFLPELSTFVSVSSNADNNPGNPNPACLPPSSDGFNRVVCNFGTVENTDTNRPPGFLGPRTVTITVRPNPSDPPPDYPRTLTNTVSAQASGDVFDRFPENNRSEEQTTVTSPGIIKLSKTHPAIPPDSPPGDPIPPSAVSYYQLRIDNTGDAATLSPFNFDGGGVENPLTVTDTLPHGFVFSGTIDDPDTPFDVDNDCTATTAGPLQNSIVTCHPQTSIPPGGHYTIYLGVRPLQTGTFTNFADATKYGGDITPGDNSASDLTHVACPKPGVRRVPQLCVFKTDSQDPVPQGQPFNYLIRVQNQRINDPNGTPEPVDFPVDINDTIPPGMTVQSATLPNGSCNVANGVLRCRVNPPIPPGGSRTITVTLIALQVGTFENVACIVQSEGPDEPCANQPTTIIAAADLAITKTGSPNPVEVNSDLTYTMKVANKGPSSVPNVQFDDSVPANTTFVSASVEPAGPSCGLQGTSNVHCDLGTMAATTSKTVTVVVRPSAPGPISNTAKVANDGSAQAPVDFDLTNNTASFTVDSRGADITIAKDAAPTTLDVGQPLTYTVRVTNNGPGVASGVKMTDTLPGAVSSPTITTTKGSCSGTANITCTIGTMNPAEVATITIRVTPNRPGSATNTARVTSDSFDTDTTNNQASATVSITASDVTISKTGGPDPVAVGTTVTYTLTVHNNGPGTASGVTVRDTLPDGVTLPTITPSRGSCLGSPVVTCTLDALAANATATVQIVVTAPLAGDGTLTNSATVSSSSFDLNNGNNDASVTTRVIEPKLELNPKLARPGFVTVATGTDFPPNAPLDLGWSRGLGKRTLTADANGSFTVQMLIFPNDQEGQRQLVATALQPDVPATNFLNATKDFLVVPNTSQPFQVKPSVTVTKIVQRSG